MRTFEQYEALSVESKRVLFNIHIELQKFEEDNKNFRIMEDGSKFYLWKTEQENKIKEKASHRRNYLEAWSNGDFINCDYHADRFNY